MEAQPTRVSMFARKAMQVLQPLVAALLLALYVAAAVIITSHFDTASMPADRDDFALANRVDQGSWRSNSLLAPFIDSIGPMRFPTVLLVASEEEALAVTRTLNSHWPEPPFVLDEYIVIVVGAVEEQRFEAASRPGTPATYFVNGVSTGDVRPTVEVVDLR